MSYALFRAIFRPQNPDNEICNITYDSTAPIQYNTAFRIAPHILAYRRMRIQFLRSGVRAFRDVQDHECLAGYIHPLMLTGPALVDEV